jgi:hypothetical protein
MDEGERVLGGWLALVGSAGVVVVTAVYASAPPLASLPLPNVVPLEQVIADNLAGASSMRLAGALGVIFDVPLIGGAMLLAFGSRGRPAARLFWLWLAMSTLTFLVADSLAASALADIAAISSGDHSAFLLARRIFGSAFLLGTGIFGAAFLVLYFETSLPPLLRYAALTAGALGLIAFGLGAPGIIVPLLLGGSIGLAGVLGVVLAWREIGMGRA